MIAPRRRALLVGSSSTALWTVLPGACVVKRAVGGAITT